MSKKINLGYPKIVGTVRNINVPEPWFWQTGYSGRWQSPEQVRERVTKAYTFATDSDSLGEFAYDNIIPYLDPYDGWLQNLGWTFHIDNYKVFLRNGEKFLVPVPASEWNVPQWNRTLDKIPDEFKFPDPRWKDQIPDDLLEALRRGQAFLLFYSLWEIGTVFPERFEKFIKENRIPASSVIIANPNLEQKKIFEFFPEKPHIIYWNSFEDQPWVSLPYDQRPQQLEEWREKYQNLKRPSKFLCLNRRWSSERLFLSGYLRAKHAESSIVSQGTSQIQKNENTTGIAAINNLQREGLDSETPIQKEIFKFYREFGDKSICVSPDQKISIGMDNATYLVKDLQNSAYINIVTETCFPYKRGIFFTEKTYKPIWCLQPFILVAAPHALEKLRNLGFQTFSRWWDESYDDIEDDQSRLEAICKLVDNLDSHPLEWFQNFYKEAEDVLVHNWREYSLDAVLRNYPDIITQFSNILEHNGTVSLA